MAFRQCSFEVHSEMRKFYDLCKKKFAKPESITSSFVSNITKISFSCKFLDDRSSFSFVFAWILSAMCANTRQDRKIYILFACRTPTNKKFAWITKQDDEEEDDGTQPESKVVQWHKKTKKVRILFSVMCPEGEMCLKRNSKIAFGGVEGRRKTKFAPRSRVSRFTTDGKQSSLPQEPINFILSSIFNLFFDKKSISGRLRGFWRRFKAEIHKICLLWRSRTPKWQVKGFKVT